MCLAANCEILHLNLVLNKQLRSNFLRDLVAFLGKFHCLLKIAEQNRMAYYHMFTESIKKKVFYSTEPTTLHMFGYFEVFLSLRFIRLTQPT